MRFFIFSFIIFTLSNSCFTQSTNWQGDCLNPRIENQNQDNSAYYIKKFKRKYAVDISIPSIQLGDTTIAIDHSFQGKIKFETDILALNDSIAIKFQLARSENNGTKELYYKLSLLKMDAVCWRPLSIFHFSPVTAVSMVFSGYGSGTLNTKDYVGLVDAVIEIE